MNGYQNHPKVTGYAMAYDCLKSEEVGYAATPKAPILMEIEMINKQITTLFEIYDQLEQRLSAYTVCSPQERMLEEEKRYRPNSPIGEMLYGVNNNLIGLEYRLRDLLNRIEN